MTPLRTHPFRSPSALARLLVSAWLGAGVLCLCAGAAGAGSRSPVRVLRVVDGDTVVVREGRRVFKVRVLGVDAPELGRDGRRAEPFADEAARFTRDALERGWRVDLQIAGDRVDDYGRTLGFLRVQPPPPGRPFDLSEELLRRGLATAFRKYEYPGKARFLGLEAEARRAGRGLWRR